MKMVRCHVKYTILRGQLETYFELMELVLFLFYILNAIFQSVLEIEGIENRVIQLKAVNACRMPESNADGWEGVMGQGLSRQHPFLPNCVDFPVCKWEKLLFLVHSLYLNRP